MSKEKIDYLINHFLYLIPIQIKSKLKYPYLQQHEIKKIKEDIAKIMITDYSDKIILNNCPTCKKLARTPKAKQCRFCGFDWH